ncbi:DUF362 domain-containing protein [Candidatus Methanomassiliicoccus intestinalis]|uniref:DUF362 domain-containing protein n=1 Tax=Candidatus Methanomassiliicoccus intestinalis TaxID=1406512 RepID=UPI0037DC4412
MNGELNKETNIHNRKGENSVIVHIEKCHKCGACVGSCPQNAIYLNDVVLEFNENCNHCGRCVKICPVGAIEMEGKK